MRTSHHIARSGMLASKMKQEKKSRISYANLIFSIVTVNSFRQDPSY